MNNKSLLISALGLALCVTTQAQVAQKVTDDKPLANYELAEHFNEFGLGGKSTRISLSVIPNAINDPTTSGITSIPQRATTTIWFVRHSASMRRSSTMPSWLSS